jgi:hypothetical protein
MKQNTSTQKNSMISELRQTPTYEKTCSPRLIIGSMVKMCPTFITPDALFSIKNEEKDCQCDESENDEQIVLCVLTLCTG